MATGAGPEACSMGTLIAVPASTSSIDAWTRGLLRNDPPRSKSLIITIFGDSLLPYVSGIWLGDLIELLRPFKVNAQLVRTSSFRLAEEGWLESKRDGRSSRYSLSESGRQRVEHAYDRIYAPPDSEWDGHWTIVIPGKEGSSMANRNELRRELEWAGFGRITAKLFLHPRADLEMLKEVLARLGLARDTVVLRARELEEFSSRSVGALSAECWNLERVAGLYKYFLRQCEPVLPLIEVEPSPETAFLVQTLLIHSFRRVVLHDPRLPVALLPPNWTGHAAYSLCKDVYRRTHKQARAYLTERLEEAPKGLLQASPNFLARFGGLD